MKIRINQDVTFNWKLTVEGESVDLSKLELSVEITTPSNKKVEITPNIQFDTLEFNYRPKQVGEYILSAYLNRFKDGETALDIKAFEGVKYSWNQDFSTNDNLEANYVELAGDFNFGPNVSSAPDVPVVPGVPSVDLSDYAKTTYVDTQINRESTARSQADSELQSKINTKQDKIIAGAGIDITDNTISCTIDTTIFKVVNSLPVAPLSRDKNKIHLVLSTNSEERNYYDEYLWVNNSWEKIGAFMPSVDLSDYATTSYVDTKASYIDTQINNEATARTQADSELQSKINTKQDTLTAGDNIKIDNNVISAIDLRPSVDLSDYAKTTYVDTQINEESTARTQADSELQSKINTKQDKIIAGAGIDITDNTISCTVDTTIFKVVDSLPVSPSSGDENKIHLVLSTNSEESNSYDEYLWVNNSWEKIGTFIPSVDLSDYAKKTYVDTQIGGESTARAQADSELQSKINTKQDTLTAGENIKIENNVISAIDLRPSVDLSDYAKTTYVDTQIENESTARAQADSELQSKINTKQDTLTAGENIKIENNVISAIDLRPSVDLSIYAEKSYVDTQIDGESTARIQADSELQSKINTKQDKIIAGTGIDITDNTISCTLDTTIFKVVDSLPVSPSSGDENKIHLVLSTNSEEGNTYDEYLWVNNSWEKIGSFIPSVDLSMYAEKSYVDSQIASETTTRTQADAELQSKINTKQDTLTAGENIKIENNVISAIDATKISVNITWSELKALMDNSQLVAGQQYRITDYTCTTTQSATKSAGHVFDIIVTADDESTLNEVARAVKHDGDEYFANSDLSAWKIWYCLDNDTNRFAWADSTNGKGVIYRMIDEFNNDVPYDFKNIQFYRQWSSDQSLWSIISTNNTGVPCYTFSSKGDRSTTKFIDTSLSESTDVYYNSIKWYILNMKKTLNNICFFGYQCNKNTFLGNCWENTFGHQCRDNSFGSYCHDNSFGVGCAVNTFGSYCSKNTFGDDCKYNSFGNECGRNSFGNGCYYNSFGNGCYCIEFAKDSTAMTKYAYYQNNHFGDGCKYIILKGAETASAESQVQNYNFAQGLQGTSNAYLSIDGKRNRAYETKVANNSSGTLKIYCEADSIQ